MIRLAISCDRVPPELQELYNQTRATTLVRLAGKTVEKELRAHFLAHKPNQKGWPSKGLWGDIAERTVMGKVGGGGAYASVEVSISHPAFGLKLFGGTVTPKRGKYLTIPATAAAYAAGSPREGATPELHVASALNPQTGSLQRCLVEEDGTVWYSLARKTTHAPDPAALPPEAALQDAIDATIQAHLQRARDRQAAA